MRKNLKEALAIEICRLSNKENASMDFDEEIYGNYLDSFSFVKLIIVLERLNNKKIPESTLSEIFSDREITINSISKKLGW